VNNNGISKYWGLTIIKRTKTMKFKLLSVAAFGLALTACSSPVPEAEPVYAQPIFSKIGEPSCALGSQIETMANGDVVCKPIS
jgi:hypothetical protein